MMKLGKKNAEIDNVINNLSRLVSNNNVLLLAHHTNDKHGHPLGKFCDKVYRAKNY